MKTKSIIIAFLALSCWPFNANAQRLQQQLGRGVVAVYGRSNGSSAVEITWRRLAYEPENAAYDIFVSQTADGGYSKLNSEPVSNTNFATTLAKVPYGSYITVALADAPGTSSTKCKPFQFKDNGLRNVYVEISYDASPLDKTKYTTKFVWPCDLNGDGEYDYVVDRCPVDGSLNYFIEAYLADGTFLWNVDLGVNEKPCDGQNDNLCAYDIDCDGYGELIVQTSDGTRFWDKEAMTWGKYLFGNETGDTDGDGVIDYNSHKTKNPPRYMTVVDGMTGAEKSSVEFMYDDAYNRTNKSSLMGDEYNKHEAHVGIFYHDGVHPAICGEWLSRDVNKQHHYRNCAFAYDFDYNGHATNWHQLFMKNIGGAEFHMIRIFDADGDGCDEMSSGAYVMDHDGSTLYNTGISHGDRHRTADIDPERPGLETFSIQQNAPDMLGMILFDATDGTPIKKWYLSGVGDVGRGECMDLDPNHLGWEMFSTMDDYQMYDAKGNKIEGKKGYFPTEGIWWDGQLDRENVNSPDGNGYNAMIVDYTKGRLIEMAKESGWTLKSSFGKRGKFWGDIIGDWREELILIREVDGVCQGIVGFTTDYKTDINDIYCLQQDPHYRGDCTTRGYYQTPCPAFYLGYDMPRPQLPPCMPGTLARDAAVDADTVLISLQSPAEVSITRADVVYAMPVKGQTVTMRNSGTSVAEGPTTEIWKGQLGTLVIPQAHSGTVYITEGAVNATSLFGTAELRARGTLTATYVDSVAVEGALHYQGCRLMPKGEMTINKPLTVPTKQKLYIELTPGSDLLRVKQGVIDNQGTIVFTMPDDVAPGTYTLIEGCAGINVERLDVRGLSGKSFAFELSDADVQSLSIIVNGQREAADGVVWTGAESDVWDFKSNNFELDGIATNFVEGDGIIFDDSAVCTAITINEKMPVSTATFANVDKDYSIKGTGTIVGRTILKSGKLTVKELDYDFEIGKATLVVNNTNAADEHPILLTDTATISVPSGTTSLKGKVSGDGVLVKSGKGQLNINYAGANAWAGTILESGTLAMGTWNTTIGKSSSPIRVTGDATIKMFDNNSTSQVPTIQNAITIDKDVTLTFNAGKRCAIKGSLKGEGTYQINFPYVRGDVSTNTSQFEGIYKVTTDNCRFVDPIDLSKATLRLDKGAAVVSMKSGSGNEQNLNHKVGTLTGPGTLGNGTWTVTAVTYSEGPTKVSGTLKLVSPVIDVTALCEGTLADDAELIIFNVKGIISLTGEPTIIPASPKEDWVWDTSTLVEDGTLRLVPDQNGITSVLIDQVENADIYDLQGRKVTNPTTGIYIINGNKVLLRE